MTGCVLRCPIKRESVLSVIGHYFVSSHPGVGVCSLEYVNTANHYQQVRLSESSSSDSIPLSEALIKLLIVLTHN